MGVQGLWQLLQPTGYRLDIETLAGKTLAVDASIWLIQFVKAMRDDESGSMVRSAHIVGSLRRILKLLFHKIKPVFVFDGGTPALKLRTLSRRRHRRAAHRMVIKETAHKLLVNQMLSATLAKVGAKADGLAPGFRAPAEKSGSDSDDIIWDSDKDEKVEKSESEDEVPKYKRRRYISKEQFIEKFRRADFERTAAVASDPMNYSKLQMSRFLKGTYEKKKEQKLKERISARGEEGKRIASEPNREYLLIDSSVPKESTVSPIASSSVRFAFDAANGKSIQSDQTSPDNSSSKENVRISKPLHEDYYLRSQIAKQVKNHIETEMRTINKNIQDRNTSPPESFIALLRSQVLQRKRLPLPKNSLDENLLRRENLINDRERSIEVHVTSSESRKIKSQGSFASIGKPVILVEDACDPEPELSRSPNKEIRKPVESKAEDLQGVVIVQPNQQDTDNTNRQKTDRIDTENSEEKSTLKSKSEIEPTVESKTRPEVNNGAKFSHTKSNVAIMADEEHSLMTSDVIEVNANSDGTGKTRENSGSETITPTETSLFVPNNNSITRSDGLAPKLSSPQSPLKVLDTSHITSSPVKRKEDSSGDILSAESPCKTQPEKDVGIQVTCNPVDSEGSLKNDYVRVEENRRHSPSPVAEQKQEIKQPQSPIVPSPQEIGSVNICEKDSVTDGAEAAAKENIEDLGASIVEGAERDKVEDLAKSDSAPSLASSSHPVEALNDNIYVKDLTTSPIQPTQTKGLVDLSNEDDVKPKSMVDSQVAERFKDSVESRVLREEKQNELDEEAKELKQMRNRSARDAAEVTPEMLDDVKELLTLMGLPFVQSPMEAEAQCARLELDAIVDGTVTEDSDSFLFGAKVVYKNIFSQRKYVETYKAENIEDQLGVNRESMIALAMLLGSDYTDGIKGIGIVNALETVRAFPGYDGLKDFAKWVHASRLEPIKKKSNLSKLRGKRKRKNAVQNEEEDENGDGQSAKTKHRKGKIQYKIAHRNARKRWLVPEKFPSPQVISAYEKPQVTHLKASDFTWEKPNVEGLRSFLTSKVGWDQSTINKTIEGPIKAYLERHYQTRLDAFLISEKDKSKFAVIQSKRLKAAVAGLREQKGEESDL